MAEEKSVPDVTRGGEKQDVRAGGDALIKDVDVAMNEQSDKPVKRSGKDYSIPLDPPDNQGGAWR